MSDIGSLVLEILREHLAVVIGQLILWSVIGLLLGISLAVAAYRLARRWGAWTVRWRHAVWIRTLTVIWLVGVLGCLGGLIGLCEGGLRGLDRVISEGPIRDTALRTAGDFTAAGLMRIDFALLNAEAGHARPWVLTPEQSSEVEAFSRGDREFEAVAFLDRLKRADSHAVRGIVSELKEELRDGGTWPQNRVADRLAEAALDVVAREAIHWAAEEKLAEVELMTGMKEMIATLPEAARGRGNPSTIAVRELSDHVIDRGIVPTLLSPAGVLIRGKQATLGAMMLGALALPMLAFWIWRSVERRRTPMLRSRTPPPADPRP